jgi:hypothetical protein
VVVGRLEFQPGFIGRNTKRPSPPVRARAGRARLRWQNERFFRPASPIPYRWCVPSDNLSRSSDSSTCPGLDSPSTADTHKHDPAWLETLLYIISTPSGMSLPVGNRMVDLPFRTEVPSLRCRNRKQSFDMHLRVITSGIGPEGELCPLPVQKNVSDSRN